MGWRRRDPPPRALHYHGLQVWISRSVGYVGEHEVLRIDRNGIGEWRATIVVAGKVRHEVFDYHPTVAVMRTLTAGGTDIADDVLDQGAEGEDIRSQARQSRDDRKGRR